MTQVFPALYGTKRLHLESHLQRRNSSKEVDHVAKMSIVLCCADAQHLSGGVCGRIPLLWALHPRQSLDFLDPRRAKAAYQNLHYATGSARSKEGSGV